MVVILSGPSGVGKDAVLSRMRELGYPFRYIVTVTTRPQRAKEKNGEDYHFLSEKRFREMIERGELLEWAMVYGYSYGVPKQPVKQAIAQSQDVIIKVDIQGADTIKQLLPGAVLIFLAPPSVEELTQRLRQRKTESAADLELRLEIAGKEMESLPQFDYVVVNPVDGVETAVSQIDAIITAEKCRVNPRVARLE